MTEERFLVNWSVTPMPSQGRLLVRGEDDRTGEYTEVLATAVSGCYVGRTPCRAAWFAGGHAALLAGEGQWNV